MSAGGRFALVVATSMYRDARFRQLVAPLNDARAFGEVLADPALGGFEVKVVINRDAHVVGREIEAFCNVRGIDDTVLLYFSCHGYARRAGELYLIARDTDKDTLRATGIAGSFLREVLHDCRAQVQVLVLDCCFGGAIADDLFAKGGEPDSIDVDTEFGGVGSGRVILTASSAREAAFEETGDAPSRASVYTRTIVDGIRSGAADIDGDGRITPQDLHVFATRRIAFPGSRQTPTLNVIGGQGEIVLAQARRRRGATSADSIPHLGDGATRGSDLRPYVRIHDQGTEAAAGTAVAAVTAMETYLAYRGAPVTLSARYLYQRAKAAQGAAPGDSPALDLAALVPVLEGYGTVPDERWAYRPGVWQPPEGASPADLDQEALRYRAELCGIRSRGALVEALRSGRPVLATLAVHESTWIARPDRPPGLIAAPTPDEPHAGSVAVVLVDVDEDAGLVRFAHSWGTTWGDRGFGSMTLQHARTLVVPDQVWALTLPYTEPSEFRWDDVAPATLPAGIPFGAPAPAPAPAPPSADRAAHPRGHAPWRRTAAQRCVYDGRRLGASYAKLTPDALLRSDGAAAAVTPAIPDEAADEVFAALGAIDRAFADAFRRDSWDGHGAPYKAVVHHGRDYPNGFWDGSAGVAVLGDGDGELFRGFYGLDIVAKEFGNAVVGQETHLEYRGESGSLFNALALVIASIVVQHAAGQTADQADWLIGAGLLAPDVRGRALISLLEPGTAYDDPVLGKDVSVGHMDAFLRTTEDNGGVHVNSGIPARAFALTARSLGGHSWERAGAVWYRALTSGELDPTSRFADFAAVTVEVARQHADADTVTAVRAAWDDVGVQPAVR